jgi:hypothetical protein
MKGRHKRGRDRHESSDRDLKNEVKRAKVTLETLANANANVNPSPGPLLATFLGLEARTVDDPTLLPCVSSGFRLKTTEDHSFEEDVYLVAKFQTRQPKAAVKVLVTMEPLALTWTYDLASKLFVRRKHARPWFNYIETKLAALPTSLVDLVVQFSGDSASLNMFGTPVELMKPIFLVSDNKVQWTKRSASLTTASLNCHTIGRQVMDFVVDKLPWTGWELRLAEPACVRLQLCGALFERFRDPQRKGFYFYLTTLRSIFFAHPEPCGCVPEKKEDLHEQEGPANYDSPDDDADLLDFSSDASDLDFDARMPRTAAEDVWRLLEAENEKDSSRDTTFLCPDGTVVGSSETRPRYCFEIKVIDRGLDDSVACPQCKMKHRGMCTAEFRVGPSFLARTRSSVCVSSRRQVLSAQLGLRGGSLVCL